MEPKCTPWAPHSRPKALQTRSKMTQTRFSHASNTPKTPKGSKMKPTRSPITTIGTDPARNHHPKKKI